MSKKEYPEVGELVIGNVTDVFPYGAFVKLDEYDKVGMIHIKEISSAWVKNIRNHVREGQKVVTKVLKVVPTKGHIDLSLRRTTAQQRKWKIQQYKREKKVEKLLEYYQKESGLNAEELETNILEPMRKEFESVLEGMEAIVRDKTLLSIIPEACRDSFFELLTANVEVPTVEITGYLDVTCPQRNGVEIIKEALMAAEDDGVTVQLVGTPRYMIKIEAEEYKVAEDILKNISESVTSSVEEHGGEVKFTRK
ncbi:MAG: translation initiation factor IF-2 subunit alpha [Theionarchaea archaeon]|nr:translation initiation factor IF-2 subunit alpha [Theionarchaea archaeon]MBU7020108.1 translation initiation factor IF-2 subunit alpha [Theionarchaea archaeon]MBU7039476.1 translation initiation factor IF-2 subunit alpha [Theionarchaea archaeon]